MNEEQVLSPTIRATDSNPKLAAALAKFQAKYCNAAASEAPALTIIV